MTDPAAKDVDVLIIGAGVNGAGVFRDLCAQGLTCVIVDKGDFGSGTSAAPSRLIHGGLKYLETGEFRLVAESTYERNLLLRNAAHLVKPLPTVIPIQSWTKGIWAALRTFFGSTTAPRSRGAVLVKAGLAIYDFYGARARQMPKHGMLGRTRALTEIPALTPRIVAVGTYYDAMVTAPERLVMELVLDGISLSPGSQALNWTAVEAQDNGVVHLLGPDGARSLRPRHVVNAAGPWIDKVNARLGLETRLIGGTKGSHILMDHPDLLRQLDGRMIYFEADDGRILLVFPFQGKALVGSTDIPAKDPDAVTCTQEEVDYFLHSLRDLLPGLHFDQGQIVYAYAGIRPLPNSEGIAPGLISRDHSAPRDAATPGRPFPVLSLVGGKWTTFRAFSAEVTDSVLSDLGAPRRTVTDDMPIGGGHDLPKTPEARRDWLAAIAAETGVSMDRLTVLLDRYGTTAEKIARHEGPEAATVPDAPDYTEAEIDWIAHNEKVVHLSDILLRRTPLAISGALTPPLARAVARVAANALGWNAGRTRQELADLARGLAEHHGVHLDLE